MPRAMVFIDFENYEIEKNKYYKTKYINELSASENGDEANTETKQMYPKLEYRLVTKELVKLLPNDYQLIKTFVFAPKPDEFLMKDKRREGVYSWINSMNGRDFLTVVEGVHQARPMPGYGYDTMDIENPDSYYVIEKGTDIALATSLLTNGFFNACDLMLVVSADTDYIPVYDILRSMGKLVVVATIEGQSAYKLRPHTDAQLWLNDAFFQKCVRTQIKDKKI